MHLQNKDKEPKLGIWVYQRLVIISTFKIKMANPSQEPPASSKAPNQDLKGHGCSLHLQIKIESKIWNIGVPKTSDHIKIKIKMPNPSQVPPASSNAPNEDLKDIDVLCTFKIKIESQNWDQGCIKASDHIKIKFKISNNSKEHPASSKAPNVDLKDMDVLCTFKIKIERQHLEHR